MKYPSHCSGQHNTMNVIEHCRVSPPPGAVADQFLPLTFFDLLWIPRPPVQKLFFYEFHHSKTHFTESLIPHLKHTLSLTLKHFFPLAANLILPSPSNSSTKPKIRYSEGDSVSLTFAESSTDFNYLTGNQARNVAQFHLLIPQIMQGVHTNVVPIAALQVTLFPESGICFGFAYNHVMADGKAFHGFLKSWASISKFGSDAQLLAGGYLPFYDRTVIKYPIGLDTIFWSESQVFGNEAKHEELCPTANNSVRATFVIPQIDVQLLKESVMARPSPTVPLHVSTFTVTCAYMWVCILKSLASTRVDHKDDDDEELLEHLVFPADCRERLDPPIPATYFGNCLAPCFATARHRQLMAEEGFFVAVGSIREATTTMLHKGEAEGVLKGAENWLTHFKSLNLDRVRSIAGSPKISLYEPDFGWGRPRKSEIVSIDLLGAFSISDCRDAQGGVEFGVSFPKITMDAFASIFVHGLKLL